jgi:predicted nucleotidyltransferase
VLRVLHGVRVPLNTSQIAAMVQLSWPAVAGALADLESMGLVHSTSAGRTWVHQLARESVYVQRIVVPAFMGEEEIPELLEQDLKEAFGQQTASIVLFGSYARGEQDERSDVDIVLVAGDPEAKSLLDADFDAHSTGLADKYGASFSPLIYDLSEAADLWRRAPALFASIKQDALVVSGLRPEEWRRHGPGE